MTRSTPRPHTAYRMTRTRLYGRLERLPMVKLVVPLAAGILLGFRYELPEWFLAAAFLISGTAALLLRSAAALLLLLLTGGFASAQLRETAPATPRLAGTHFEVRITGIPSDRGAYTSAEAIVEAWRDPSDGRWRPAADRIVVRADSLTPLADGERLLCYGTIVPLRSNAPSYLRLMRRRGFIGTLRIAERHVARRSAGGRSLHRSAVDRLARLPLTPPAAATVRAMAAGDRSTLTSELRADYARSGFAHLLAVSGLHTGIVFLLANLLLCWLPLVRRGHLIRHLAVTAAVWLFTAAAGFPPSAIRAAVMCTLLQFALTAASEYVALNALAAAAFGMLLWNPAWLGDIAFQLSFAAVAGILAWGVPLCRRLRTRRRIPDALLHAYLIGLTATLATAPLLAHSFGNLPLAGIALNPLAILLATVVVAVAVGWMVLPLAPLAPLSACILEHATGLLNRLAARTAELPGGSLPWSPGTRTTMLIYLLFVAGTLAAWSVERKKSVHLPS